MSSILTNNSAMVALQTLSKINSNLGNVQSQISTGKEVASAKDNAAVFAISKVMESDVAGFEAVSDSLNLGNATVSVASNAAESVGSLLNEIKGKIVSANADNVDRDTIQNEITSLAGQITSIVESAQFNGLNLVDGSSASFDVLSSLNRGADGTVTTGQVSLDTSSTNLTATGGLALAAGAFNPTGDAAGTDESGTPGGFDNTGSQVVAAAGTYSVDIAGLQGGGTALRATDVAGGADPTDDTGMLVGDTVDISVGSTRGTYTVREGDSQADVAAGLRTSLIDAGIDTTAFTVATNGTALEVTNNTALEVRVDANGSRGSGGLASLSTLSVATAGDAATALGTIDSLIQTTVDAQAALGTTEKRLEIQSSFMDTLVDSFNSGIGALVDADLEETSAKLQALQVQQQLATQSLSIANQAPQSILSLFR